MSDTLARFAEPLLEDVPCDVDSWQRVIDVAVLVWNSLVSRVPRDEIVDNLAECVGDRPLGEVLVDELTERRRRLFANDRRLVAAAEVYRQGSSMHITAASIR